MSIDKISNRIAYLFILILAVDFAMGNILKGYNMEILEYSTLSIISHIAMILGSVYLLNSKVDSYNKFRYSFKNIQITSTFIFLNITIWLFLDYALKIGPSEKLNNGFLSIVILISSSIVEEYVFRYKIFNLLKEHGFVFAIIGSAIIFGMFHIERFYVTFFMGLNAALIYFYTKNIIYPIVANIIVSSSVVFDLAYFIFRVNRYEIFKESYLVIPLIVCIFLLFLISFIIGLICGYYGKNSEMKVNLIKMKDDFKVNIKKLLLKFPFVLCLIFSMSITIMFVVNHLI